MKRQLKFFDILCLGLNAIVGSGIFLIPGRLVAGVGASSIFLFVLCGLLLIIVGLCFAEASSQVDRNGGPYHYASKAFGPQVGFITGWIAVVTAFFSYATVANGLPQYLGMFLPGFDVGVKAHAISIAVILLLALINHRGVRLGANVVNLFTVSKLVPLLILIVPGIFFIDWTRVSPIVPTNLGDFTPMFGLILAVVFTYQGFEVSPVPAGETDNPKRNVPRAVMGSLFVAMVLYALVQTVVVGSGADVAASETPLSTTGIHLFGPWAGTLFSIGAVISMFGYCAGMALGAPRYLTVLCEDGFLPKAGAKEHPKFNTPVFAIWFIAAVTILLTLTLDFNRLVDISALAVVLQYIVTCAAIPILRKKYPVTAGGYQMPFGPLLPALGVAICGLFIVQIRWPELQWALCAVAIGLIFEFGYRAFKKNKLAQV